MTGDFDPFDSDLRVLLADTDEQLRRYASSHFAKATAARTLEARTEHMEKAIANLDLAHRHREMLEHLGAS